MSLKLKVGLFSAMAVAERVATLSATAYVAMCFTALESPKSERRPLNLLFFLAAPTDINIVTHR